MSDTLSFRTIEARLGIRGTAGRGDSPLESWYASVRDKPLSQFSDKDLATCCRQRLYLEFIIPFVINRLEQDPLAGHLYEGELLVALASLPTDFWKHSSTSASRVRNILESLHLQIGDEDVLNAIQHLRSLV